MTKPTKNLYNAGYNIYSLRGSMRITATALSIPPYISVAWKDVSSLHTKPDASSPSVTILVVTLRSQLQVEVPYLDSFLLEDIFDTFAKYNELEKTAEKKLFEGPFHFSLPLKKEMSKDSMITSISHNPEQANLPDLPSEMLEKVTQIAKAFGLEDSSLLPAPEPDCNCVHCQIIRSLHGETPTKLASVEEEISEADLSFRGWDIKQTQEKLYTVTNPLDANEHYTVFLGAPLGCTCGHKNCEHIKAVLST